MTKGALQAYYDDYINPNHEHYLDHAWWAGIINTYLQEL